MRKIVRNIKIYIYMFGIQLKSVSKKVSKYYSSVLECRENI